MARSVLRNRLRSGLVLFVLSVAAVFTRLVELEWTQGAAHRTSAARPLVRTRSVPGIRGRILARDGTVLAVDEQVVALAVHYRWLQEPPDEKWLREMVRRRLPRPQRRDPERVEAERELLLAQREELHRRLAELAGVPPSQWQQRTARIDTRVRGMADRINRLREEKGAPGAKRAENTTGRGSWLEWLDRQAEPFWSTPEDSGPIVIAEELEYHIVAEGLSVAAVAEIEGNPQLYPGVRVRLEPRRRYPLGPLASHVLGYLAWGANGLPVQAGNQRGEAGEALREGLTGQMGVELKYDGILRGQPGAVIEHYRSSGEIVGVEPRQQAGIGRDLLLTLDLALQRRAESLLDQACQRREVLGEAGLCEPAGGAVVVMDVHNGAILAAASAPRFDPNLLAGVASRSPSPAEYEVAALLADAASPLFDRSSRMALPPGSVFKPLAAVALLEELKIDPRQPLFCRGYLHDPSYERCQIYRRLGVGHGPVTMVRALSCSCNVYFFDGAAQLGPQPLIEWAGRFGFGRTTGSDLPGEAAGSLPAQEESARAGRDEADAKALAIGQGALTATPLQVVRMMAAIANGGVLVTPHVVQGLALQDGEDVDQEVPPPKPHPIPDLDPQTLAFVREGLVQVVADPQGTAHATVHLPHIAVAGKTGTAQAGGERPDHAWFAGYAPADAPRVAFVVVLEHAGDGGAVAGPVAQRLLLSLEDRGYLRR